LTRKGSKQENLKLNPALTGITEKASEPVNSVGGEKKKGQPETPGTGGSKEPQTVQNPTPRAGSLHYKWIV